MVFGTLTCLITNRVSHQTIGNFLTNSSVVPTADIINVLIFWFTDTHILSAVRIFQITAVMVDFTVEVIKF